MGVKPPELGGQTLRNMQASTRIARTARAACSRFLEGPKRLPEFYETLLFTARGTAMPHTSTRRGQTSNSSKNSWGITTSKRRSATHTSATERWKISKVRSTIWTWKTSRVLSYFLYCWHPQYKKYDRSCVYLRVGSNATSDRQNRQKLLWRLL